MYKFRKGEYARVVRDKSVLELYQLPYAGQIAQVDEDDYVPYCICSDGERHAFSEDELEKLIMKRGDRGFFWDDDESKAKERIFIEESPGAEYPYRVVHKSHEDKFLAYENGDHVTFRTNIFKHCKPLPDKIKVTVEIGGKEQTAYISRESAKALELI